MSLNKLLIISHTHHYLNSSGKIVGWGPTVAEINYLVSFFDEIYHLATFHDGDAPKSAIPYTSNSIHFESLKPTGGSTLGDKLSVLWNAPSTIKKVHQLLKKVNYFQLRTPTGIGTFLIPYLMFFESKKGWFKYAGNWNQQNASIGYSWQRWLLKHQKRVVTINGSWPDQPAQCLTFENPCLSFEDRKKGNQTINIKSFDAPYTFCFAGRLEDEKGVGRIIKAFTGLKNKNVVSKVHLIGNGIKMEEYKLMAENSGVDFFFHGFQNRDVVFKIFKESHFFLLPSNASEGFPKVIAEALNFGCIPIVSDISSIGQYIKEGQNGLIVKPVTDSKLKEKINDSYCLTLNEVTKMQQNNYDIAGLFTYEHYLERIKVEIIT